MRDRSLTGECLGSCVNLVENADDGEARLFVRGKVCCADDSSRANNNDGPRTPRMWHGSQSGIEKGFCQGKLRLHASPDLLGRSTNDKLWLALNAVCVTIRERCREQNLVLRAGSRSSSMFSKPAPWRWDPTLAREE